MTSGEAEQLGKLSTEFIQSEARCLLCNLNMSKRFLDNNQAQVQYQLSGPCQQCQNHSLEHFIRALRRNDSKEEFLTL